jgi:iron complex outermembrane receptor protein
MRTQASLAGVLLCVIAAGSAKAQSVEEIVVTAQRRAENVQDVPIAITGFSSEAMDEGRIQTTQDLQFHVPSLNFGYLSVFSKVYLRGIGTDITSQGADGAVATYIDGIYVPGQSSQIQGLLGTERIEVLAGPQGTLYGRNAVAGAINIYSLTPTEETDFKVSVGTGDYDRREFTGHFSGGVTDTLAMGIYGGYIKRDTFFDIVNVDALQFGMQNDMHDWVTDETQWGIRLKAVWKPSENLKITGSIDWTMLEGVEGGIFRNVQPNAVAYGFEPYQQQNGDGSIFQGLPGKVWVDLCDFRAAAAYR